jgi:endoglucanase
MQRGVNLSHWFEYERGQGLDGAEMKGLRALGLDHVRIPVDPVVGGWDPVRGGRLAFLPELQAAVAMALDAGLEVVVDLHLEPADKQRIEDGPDTETNLLALWTQLAGALARTPRERVAFELFNEPQYYGLKRWRWPPLQRRLLAAVRAQVPRHLVLLSGHGGGSLEALTSLTPLDDTNLAYVFHHYEPFFFTHQGAAWLDERYTTAGLRRGLRWPPDPAADANAPLSKPHPKAAAELNDYLRGGWGPKKLRAEVARAATWARAKGVRVVCNEFGAIRANIDPASRYRWLGDVRRALESEGIGWTVWDYTDIFGLTAESAQPGRVGQRTLEAAAVAALGLGPTAGPKR